MVQNESGPGAEDRDEDMALVDKCADFLKGYYDSVQVFVSKHNDEKDCTIFVSKGAGNWSARYGQVKEWLVRTENGFYNIQDIEDE